VLMADPHDFGGEIGIQLLSRLAAAPFDDDELGELFTGSSTF